MTTYLITGATGNLGRRIAGELRRLAPTGTITALVRPGSDPAALEEQGVTIVRGDYEDLSSLDRALAGVSRLVLVSSPVLDPTTRTRHHGNVIGRAVRAGVDHVVYTSALGAEHDPGHLSTEQSLADSVPHTILRNGLYSEPFARRALGEAASHGYITSSTGGRPVRTASMDDLAAAASLAATETDPRSSTLSLNGAPWTYDELARHLSIRLGRDVTHRQVADDLGPVGQVHALFRRGLLAQSTGDLTRLLGRGPRTIEAVVDGLALRTS